MQMRVDKTKTEYGIGAAKFSKKTSQSLRDFDCFVENNQNCLDELLHIIKVSPSKLVHMIRHTIKWYYGIRLDVYCGYKQGIDGCFECYVKDTSIPYKFCLTAEHYKTKKGYDRVSIIDGKIEGK